MNYTYILQCADGTYYTGWTNNLEKKGSRTIIRTGEQNIRGVGHR